MEFDWIVRRMKEDHPDITTRGSIRMKKSTHQRQRASTQARSYWLIMKQKVQAGEFEWIQKTYPKFWETRQDYINKYKP